MSKAAVGNLHDIQHYVDEIARRLQRSVEVTTPSIAVIAASAQLGPIDGHRAASILNRTPPPEPIPWMLSFGIQEATAPVRLPAHPGYDMLPRVVIPLRRGLRLVGHVWIINEPALGEVALTTVDPLLDALIEQVDRRDAPLAARAEQAREMARDLMAGHDDALARAHELDLLPVDGELRVHRLHIAGDLGRLALELARPLHRRPFLALDVHDSLVLIESPRNAADSAALLEEVASAALTAGAVIAARGSAAVGAASAVGAGVRRARHMADIAKLTGIDALDWSEAGAWRLLLGWDLSPATVRTLSPEAGELLRAGGDSYWRSVLAYLDHARDVTATAAELYIHRATLHYRLGRVRELIGHAALEEGWRATALHVALRLHAALEEGK